MKGKKIHIYSEKPFSTTHFLSSNEEVIEYYKNKNPKWKPMTWEEYVEAKKTVGIIIVAFNLYGAILVNIVLFVFNLSLRILRPFYRILFGSPTSGNYAKYCSVRQKQQNGETLTEYEKSYLR